MKRKILFTTCLLGALYTGNAQSNTSQNEEVDPFTSYEDKSPSWKGEKVDVDKYYDIQPDGGYIKKDTGYQKPSNQSNDNTVLIVVILIVGAVVTNNQKNTNNGHDRE